MNPSNVRAGISGVMQSGEQLERARRQLELVRESIDLGLFLEMVAVSLAAAFFASFLYRFFYERRGTGSQVNRAFPLLAIAVTTLFVGVQVSIPLSLGLLGSLSIIRFRTPIKEPEEVGFIMLVIASSICSATRNFAFVFWLQVFALAAVLLQRAAAGAKWATRDGVLVLSLPDAEADAKGAAVREALSRLLGRHRLESAASRGGTTTWQYVFSHLKCDGAEFRGELAKAAAFDSVDLFLDRPGGIR